MYPDLSRLNLTKLSLVPHFLPYMRCIVSFQNLTVLLQKLTLYSVIYLDGRSVKGLK